MDCDGRGAVSKWLSRKWQGGILWGRGGGGGGGLVGSVTCIGWVLFANGKWKKAAHGCLRVRPAHIYAALQCLHTWLFHGGNPKQTRPFGCWCKDRVGKMVVQTAMCLGFVALSPDMRLVCIPRTRNTQKKFWDTHGIHTFEGWVTMDTRYIVDWNGMNLPRSPTRYML